MALAPEIDSAIRLLLESREHLISLYLDLDPDDPGYEEAVASTAVPPHLAALSWTIDAARGHLLHLKDRLAD